MLPDSNFQRFQQFSELQSEVMNLILSLNSDLALRSFEQVLKLNQKDLTQIKSASKAVSSILTVTKDSLHQSPEIRSLLAKFAADQFTYQSILTQARFKEEAFASNQHSLFIKLKQLVLNSLPNLINEYCSNLDSTSPDCELEPDQVLIYKQSPESLANLMVSEYISSSQSWIHPLEVKAWKTNAEPKTVSTLEYHLNPLLRQFENKPNAAESVFDFIKINQKSNWKLIEF
jgi:hypothetical protein